MMMFFIPSVCLIEVFLILSIRVTPKILRRHIISKVRTRFSSTFFSVHVSAPQSSIDRIRAL